MTNMAESGSLPALDILVVGNTSTGKSALINKMIEKDGEAKEADDEQCKETISVKDYDYSLEGLFAGKIWDTPGLQDGTADDDDISDDEHISEMKKKGGFDKAGLMLYCIKLSNTRFQPEDRETIKNLTKGLGRGVWGRAIFVLTFANDAIARLERKNKYRPLGKPVHEAFKDDIMSTWRTVLHTEVKKTGVSSGVAESIPVVPAGYELNSIGKSYLEDGNDWIESLWNVCKARKPQPTGYQKLITSVTDSLGSTMASLGRRLRSSDRESAHDHDSPAERETATWSSTSLGSSMASLGRRLRPRDRESAYEQTSSLAERGTQTSTESLRMLR